MSDPREKGIEPPQTLGVDVWDTYWLRWFKRLRDVIPKFGLYEETLTPVSVAANTTVEQTFTVTGLTTNDLVFVNKPSSQAGLGIAGTRVTATNTLGITYINPTGGAIVPTSEDYKILTVRL